MPTVYYSSSSLNDAQHGMGAAASSSRDHSPFSRRDRTRRDRLPISGQVPLALVAESLPIVDQAHPGRMEAVDFAQADDAAQFAGEGEAGGVESERRLTLGSGDDRGEAPNLETADLVPICHLRIQRRGRRRVATEVAAVLSLAWGEEEQAGLIVEGEEQRRRARPAVGIERGQAQAASLGKERKDGGEIGHVVRLQATRQKTQDTRLRTQDSGHKTRASSYKVRVLRITFHASRFTGRDTRHKTQDTRHKTQDVLWAIGWGRSSVVSRLSSPEAQANLAWRVAAVASLPGGLGESFPARVAGVLHTEPGQGTADRGCNDVVEGLRPSVERRNRWEDHGAGLGGELHQSDVARMKGRFAHHQDQRATFFEANVRRTGCQLVGIAVGDGREGLDGAWYDDHPPRIEGSGGDAGSDVAWVV